MNATSFARSDFEAMFGESLHRIEAQLVAYLEDEAQQQLPGSTVPHARLNPATERFWQALRYPVMAGGKRLRPLLLLESCMACGGQPEWALPAACALELVHTYSLVHDDLPCMDNDDLRRGMPTVHKAYDEATAVLVGDALFSLATAWILRHTPRDAVTAETLLTLLEDWSLACSVRGLVNGQFVDMYYEGQPCDPDTLQYIHRYKTGALMALALRAGALLAGASPLLVTQMTQLGETIGLAFQIVDDLLDTRASTAQLGKTAGKDQTRQKATYPAVFGVAASEQQLSLLIEQAQRQLSNLAQRHGVAVTRLEALVSYTHTRVF
ncbi:MAG: polyprenyl synthetase family protein [Candidatus Melainabacteria bacterium]|nr:polyprenyl synthetase family protein [Candidatus Melainabacteria bacterium]